MVIWKYELEMTDQQSIIVPGGASFLSVANQRGKLCLWALIFDLSQPRVSRQIEIVGTGNPMSSGRRVFIGTVIVEPFVWHVFEFIG